MPVNENKSKSLHVLDTEATIFPIGFDVILDIDGNAKDIACKKSSVDINGKIVIAPLARGEDYKVSGVNIVYADGVNYPGDILVVHRDSDFLQPLDFINNGSYKLEDFEKALDKLTLMIQQIKEEQDRNIKIPISDTQLDMTLPSQAVRSSHLLGCDTDGKIIAATGITAAVTDYIKTLLDDPDEETARSTLDVYSKAESEGYVDANVDQGVKTTDTPSFRGLNISGKEIKIRHNSFAVKPVSLTQVGTAYSFSIGNPVLKKMPGDNNLFAMADNLSESLRMLEWNGSALVLVGSALSFGNMNGPKMVPINENTVVLQDSLPDTIGRYTFNGSTWSLVGSTTTCAYAHVGTLIARDEDHVSLVGSTTWEYEWDAVGLKYDLIKQYTLYPYSSKSTADLIDSETMVVMFASTTDGQDCISNYLFNNSSGEWEQSGTPNLDDQPYSTVAPRLCLLSSNSLVVTQYKYIYYYELSDSEKWERVGDLILIKEGYQDAYPAVLDINKIAIAEGYTENEVIMYELKMELTLVGRE